MDECNHFIGISQDSDYSDHIEYVFIDSTDHQQLSELLKSRFRFCPNCGVNLDGMVEKRISELESMKKEREEFLARQKAENESKFNLQLESISKETNLGTLLDVGFKYIIRFNTGLKYPKNSFVSGDKNFLLRNLTHYKNTYRDGKILIESIKKNNLDLKSIMLGLGFDHVNSPYSTLDFKKSNLYCSIGSDLKVYVDETYIDQDGDTSVKYLQFLLDDFLRNYLKLDIDLENIQY